MTININHTKNTITSEGKLQLEASNNVSVTDNRITDLLDPIDDQDAVTKQYLEAQIAGLTVITDLLRPQTPAVISSKTIEIIDTSSYRITEFNQIDNTSTGLSASPGTIVDTVKRNNSYGSNTLEQIGPGDSGQLSPYHNGTEGASYNFNSDLNQSGTSFRLGKSDYITITNNVDYGTITGDALGFSQSYDARAHGVAVPEGWNSLKLEQLGQETNTAIWYADLSDPGTPEITNISIVPSTVENIVYSSGIRHYTYQQEFDIEFDVNKLSGDFYPLTDNFIDAQAILPTGSGLRALTDINYATAGIQTPLPRNYLTDGSTFRVSTTANVQYGTGISNPNVGPSAIVDNSYHTATVSFPVAERILYMFDDYTTGAPVDETKIIVSNVGYGTGDGYRVETVDGDTPVESTTYASWVGETTTLNNYDATVVGGVASHDTTDYSTGYLPAGPDLSTGREQAQYINLAFNRTATSKFKITYTGKLSGLWVRLPGTTIDNTSTLNGWMDATIPYEGIGVPGANTSAGGNGSNGCGLASVISTEQVTSSSTNITFGTESSSNANNNIIVVRIKLDHGDKITSIKFETAS